MKSDSAMPLILKQSILLTSCFFSSCEDYWQPEGTSVRLILRFLTTDITDEHGFFADFSKMPSVYTVSIPRSTPRTNKFIEATERAGVVDRYRPVGGHNSEIRAIRQIRGSY